MGRAKGNVTREVTHAYDSRTKYGPHYCKFRQTLRGQIQKATI